MLVLNTWNLGGFPIQEHVALTRVVGHPVRKMIQTKGYMEWNHEDDEQSSTNRPQKTSDFQGVHYGHKPHPE